MIDLKSHFTYLIVRSRLVSEPSIILHYMGVPDFPDTNTALQATKYMGVESERMFKTIVDVRADGAKLFMPLFRLRLRWG